MPIGRPVLFLIACMVLATAPAGADDRAGGGTVERRGSNDGADLTALDVFPGGPGGPGDGLDGCGLWRSVSVFDLGGVPPEMLVGLSLDEGRIRRTSPEGFAQSLYRRVCADRAQTFELGWFDDSPALRDLVLQARTALVLPVPAAEFSPPGATVRTLVGIDTWFWVPATQWVPEEESVSAGAVTVTATANPLALRFDPGDGAPPVECIGPGAPWEQGGESQCSYTYQWVSTHHESGAWPASVELDWEVTWTSNVGQAGVLEPFTMVSAAPMTVAEAQAVLRLPRG